MGSLLTECDTASKMPFTLSTVFNTWRTFQPFSNCFFTIEAVKQFKYLRSKNSLLPFGGNDHRPNSCNQFDLALKILFTVFMGFLTLPHCHYIHMNSTKQAIFKFSFWIHNRFMPALNNTIYGTP